MSGQRIGFRRIGQRGRILGLAVVGFSLLIRSVLPAAAQTAAELVPSDIRKKGTLSVATSMVQPPYSFETPDGKPVGIDVELMEAIGKELGLETKFTKIAFASIIPGVENGRFDVGANEIADTEERRKVVQFVDYYRVTYGVLVTAGTKGMSSTNLCGGHFAVTHGSAQVVLLENMSAECEKAGKAAIKRSVFPDSATAKLAVSNNRAQAFVSDKGTAAYLSKIPENNFGLLDGDIPNLQQIAGFAVSKNRSDLANALKKALENLAANGEYKRILEKYDVYPAKLETFAINGG